MEKYNFDYYIQRAEILSEMANLPKKLLSIGPAGEKMYQYKKIINNVMKSGGSYTDEDGVEIDVPGLPSGKGTPLQNRGNRYIIRAISGLMDEVPEDYENARDENDFTGGGDELTKKALEILGLAGEQRWRERAKQEFGIVNSGDLYSRAIEKWTAENQEKVLSDEFGKWLTDSKNILEYLSPPVRKASHTAYGQRKTAEKEELYGMDLEDLHSIISSIAPYLKKIHELQGYGRRKKLQMTPGSSKKMTGSDEGINNAGTKNVAIILAVLENLIAAKAMFSTVIKNNVPTGVDFNEILNTDNPNELDENARQILGVILQQAVAANERYLDNEFSDTEISALLKLNPESQYADLLTEMLEFFEELVETGLTVEEIQKELKFYQSSILDPKIYPIIGKLNTDLLSYTDEEPNVEYPEYSQEILTKVLTSPELQQSFKLWYTKVYLPTKIKKLQKEIQTREFSKGGREALPGETTKMQNRANDKSKKLEELEAEYENPEYAGDIKKSYSESYVMGYMTEQVQKDKFKPRGEFKDRGFKRPRNYAEGKWMNR